MKNLKAYSNKELSLNVFNDEYFYNELDNPEYLLALVKEEFIYTDAQFKFLMNDIDSHNKELKQANQFFNTHFEIISIK